MLDGKVIIVTGGAGLIGSTFCAAIAENHGTVVIADFNTEAATNLADTLNAKGVGKALPLHMDITDKESIQALIKATYDKFGKIDALVNNAYPRNKNYGRKLEDVEYSDFTENMASHLGGYFLVSQQLSIFFAAQKAGNIVNICSIYGFMPPKFELYEGTGMTMPVEYAAIKSGILHLTRYFGQFYKKQNIRVNSLSPGGIEDGQPASFQKSYAAHCGTKGMLDANDLSGSLLFLLSDASRYLTGQNIVVDDGFSL